MQKISMGLSVKEIDAAIQELGQIRRKIVIVARELVEYLTKFGVEYAKAEIREMGAVYTGELEKSISGVYSPELQTGIIRSDCVYAVYVEFGTGVVGQENPHPEAALAGVTYDRNNHGEDGWIYYNERDGKFHWTKGMVSRPFMYNTARAIERENLRKARELFRK